MAAKFLNYAGYWLIYDDHGDNGLNIVYFSDDPIQILIKISERGSGEVMFYPNNMGVKEAYDWWEKEKVKYNQILKPTVYRESDQRTSGGGLTRP